MRPRVRSKIIPGRVQPPPANSGRSLGARGAGWYARISPVWRFALKLSFLMALYYVLVLTPFCERMLYAYLGANASLANGILHWFGEDSQVAETTIRSSHYAITVRRGCDAIEPSWFFCAAILSFPVPVARKLPGIVAGAVLLQALNLVRIVSLYFIGIYYPKFFGTAHLEIWPMMFILAALLLWIGWIQWARRAPRPASHGTA